MCGEEREFKRLCGCLTLSGRGFEHLVALMSFTTSPKAIPVDTLAADAVFGAVNIKLQQDSERNGDLPLSCAMLLMEVTGTIQFADSSTSLVEDNDSDLAWREPAAGHACGTCSLPHSSSASTHILVAAGKHRQAEDGAEDDSSEDDIHDHDSSDNEKLPPASLIEISACKHNTFALKCLGILLQRIASRNECLCNSSLRGHCCRRCSPVLFLINWIR